ncbi:MAG: nitrate/sulfonate/bicarbonate ABC transporter ATP-binding protein [Bacteriovoracia bacterium]
MNSLPLIELKNISKVYELESGTDLKVLEKANLSVYENEIVALFGASGAGKSTLLRIMSGLIEPSSGEVLVRNQKLIGTNLEVSMVFQSFALFPWETVQSNIAMALKPLKISKAATRMRIKKAVDIVGLEGFEEAYPRELSGGMKQRVGIARALVMERPVLLLDEPFSSLDVLTADTLRSEVANIWLSKKTATTSLVLVTHNIQEAVSIAKRILIMGSNPGYIKKEIINDLPYPRDEASVSFQKMVTRIHELVTEALIPDQPAETKPTFISTAKPEPEAVIECLPNIQISTMIGLLEFIADLGGTTDIFALSQKIGKDFGSILYLAKAAELLELVETPRHTILLTDLGKRLVEGDINIRKRLLHELLAGLQIVKLSTQLLRTKDQFRIPIEQLEEKMAEWLPNENPHQVVETLISWGRFAEYFGYNDDTKEVYLDLGQETA